MFGSLRRLLFGNLRKQLTVGIVLVVTTMISLAVWDMTRRQKAVEMDQHSEQVTALANSTATSSAVWVISRDFSGLQEIIQGVARYPDVRHAIVLDLRGQILAHNDPTKIGLYLTDLTQKPGALVLLQTASSIDVTSPIMLADRPIGWVRIVLDRAHFDADVTNIWRSGIVYALLGSALSVLLAYLASRYLTRRLSAIQQVANAVQAGESGLRVVLSGDDEAAQLARQFNGMMDSLAQRQETLKVSEERFRSLTEMSSDFYWETDAEHRLTQRTESKAAAQKAIFWEASSIGKRRWEIPGHLPDESGWQKHREILDAHLPFRGFEISRLRSNGEEHHVSLSGDPVFSTSGEFKGYRGVGADITERKAGEDQLRKLSLAVEQSPESIMITNLDAEIEYVNGAFVHKTGYSREEAIGKNPRILHSGKTPVETFAAMWGALTKGQAWKGDFYNQRKDGSEYIEHAVITPIRQPDGTVTHYVAVKEDITAQRASEDRINTLAFFDSLTSLPNRRLLLDRLKQALASSGRSGRYGAILFIDLDNFKTLNDTLGHDIGDLLLQQVAQRLITCVREGDTVARLGGDEFVVMLEDLSETIEESATLSKTVGEKILSALNQPYQLASYPHHSTPSIGVTLFSDQQETIDELLKRADLAMYQAKAAGRNTLRFFDPEMQSVVTTRAALEADLREAVLKGQFLLHYQAQVVGEGRVTGVEVLLRWQHPQRGMVSPADFIPLAEDTGLILPLGHWVLQTACAQLALWAVRPEMANLTIAVNVSARQFHHKDFVDQVQAVLDHTGASPQRLKLELTESLLVDDVEGVIAKMAALKMKGVGFSMDDFGTGYSSLSYLKRLPLDQLKIDQGFVRDILTDANDAAIAKMVVVLAESLALVVIAEGVETEPQREFLAHHGCHAYQGYLFSRPLPLHDFERLACKAFDDEQRLLRG